MREDCIELGCGRCANAALVSGRGVRVDRHNRFGAHALYRHYFSACSNGVAAYDLWSITDLAAILLSGDEHRSIALDRPGTTLYLGWPTAARPNRLLVDTGDFAEWRCTADITRSCDPAGIVLRQRARGM